MSQAGGLPVMLIQGWPVRQQMTIWYSARSEFYGRTFESGDNATDPSILNGRVGECNFIRQTTGEEVVDNTSGEHPILLLPPLVGEERIRPMLASPVAKPDPRLRTELLKASAGQCRFIVSDGMRDAICYGAPAEGGSSWCAWHRQIVYTPFPARGGQKTA
jgi:hypothetical protein